MSIMSQDEVIKALLKYNNLPLEFIEHAFYWGKKHTMLEDLSLSKWQRSYLKSLRKEGHPNNIKRLAVGAGNGVGKTTLISFIVLWFLLTQKNVKIVITSARESQLKTTVWDTLRTISLLCKYKSLLRFSSMRLDIVGYEAERSIIAVPWSIERPEGLAGLHAGSNMVVFDEASAIPDIIWNVARGMLSTGNSYFLAFGNITRSNGRFYDLFHSLSDSWRVKNISCLDCEHINEDFITEIKQQYGIGSDQYRIYVLGLWPLKSSSSLIDITLVQDSFKREANYDLNPHKRPIYMGVDIAGGKGGGDYSVIIIRQGYKILHCFRANNYSIPEFEQEILYKYHKFNVVAITIDSVGVGLSVFQNLKMKNINVTESEPANKPIILGETCANRRSELFCFVRDWFKSGQVSLKSFPYQSILLEELSNISITFYQERLLKVAPKSEIKKLSQNVKSPDLADALSYSFLPEILKIGMSEDGDFDGKKNNIVCSFKGSVL